MRKVLHFTAVAILFGGCSSPPETSPSPPTTNADASPDVSSSGSGGGNGNDASGNSGDDATNPVGSSDAGGGGADAGAQPDAGGGMEDDAAPDAGATPDSMSTADAALNSQVLAIELKVAKYGVTQYGNAGCDWSNAAFYPGLMAAYRATGDATLLDAAKAWGAKAKWAVCTANPKGPTFADNQCCTQTYSELYLLDESAANQVMIQSAQSVFDSMIAKPVAGRTLWYWADALFMAPPAIARMGAATHDNKYFTLLDTEYWDATVPLFSTAKGLFWRNPPTSPTDNTFWSRGNGWVIAGTARVLDYLPASDAKYGAFVTQFKTMAAALAPLQNQTDGLWRSNLLDPAQYPNPETSGSAFFVYAMAWGVARGVLDSATYLPIIRKGWDGLVGTLNAAGAVGWVQGVGSAPGPATMTSTAPYAAGGFLLAGSEVAKVY